MLFEVRIVDDTWCLDSFNQSGAEDATLMNWNALHPLGAWYHVAIVYDGKEFRNYVDGVQEGAASLHLARSRAGPCLGRNADQQGILFQGSRSPGAIHAQSAFAFRVSQGRRKAKVTSGAHDSLRDPRPDPKLTLRAQSSRRRCCPSSPRRRFRHEFPLGSRSSVPACRTSETSEGFSRVSFV